MNEKIFEALTALANKLGTTAEYLWGFLVAQGKIDFFMWLPWIATFVVFLVLFVKQLKKMEAEVMAEDKDRYRGHKDWDDLSYASWGKLVTFGTVSLISILGALINCYGAIIGLLNPEYAAIRRLLAMLVSNGGD